MIDPTVPVPVEIIGFEGQWVRELGAQDYTAVGGGAAVVKQGADLLNPTRGSRSFSGMMNLAEYLADGAVTRLETPIPVEPSDVHLPLYVVALAPEASRVLFRLAGKKVPTEKADVFPSFLAAEEWGKKLVDEVLVPELARKVGQPEACRVMLRIGGGIYTRHPRLAALRVIYRRLDTAVETSIRFNGLWALNKHSPWTAEERAEFEATLDEFGLQPAWGPDLRATMRT